MFIKIVHPISNQTGWSQHCSYQRPLQNLKTLDEVRIRTFIQRDLDRVHFLFRQSHKVGLKERFRYVVIGAGKTGLDAILYLLDHHVNPEKIHWVISLHNVIMIRSRGALIKVGESVESLLCGDCGAHSYLISTLLCILHFKIKSIKKRRIVFY